MPRDYWKALGLRALAAGWDYPERSLNGNSAGSYLTVVLVEPDEDEESAIEGLSVLLWTLRGEYALWYNKGADPIWPDFSDPATYGCLFGAVAEHFPQVWLEPRWEGGYTARGLFMGPSEAYRWAETRAEALVLALELHHQAHAHG